MKVGIFAVIIIVILAYATVKVSDRTVTSAGGYDLSVTLPNVTGLKMKAPIELAGVPVGVIKKIELLENNRARVTFLIDNKVKLPLDSKAVLRTRGFLGETYVELIPGSPDAGYLKEGDNIKSTAHTGDMNTLVSQLNLIADDLKKITGSLAEIEAGEAKAPINRIIENLDQFTLAMRDLTVNNQENINRLAENMAVVATELRSLVVQGRKDVEESLAALASITGKIDRGEGTVGRLINDEETVDKLNEVADNLNETLGGFKKMQLELGYHGEYLGASRDFKHYVHFGLKPTPDKAFLLDVIADPSPRATHVERTTQVTVGGSTSTVTTQTAEVDRNKLKISAQLAKEFYDFRIRAGIIESSGGVGMDYNRGPMGLHFEAFDFSTRFGEKPHLKAMADVALTRNFYLLGGADDFINPNQSVDWFVGAGLRFVDDDFKKLIGLGATAAR